MHGPPPLRDQRFPDGLPPHLLSAKNLLHVRSANRLYSFMKRNILLLDPNKIWTIENPLRSWLWATSYVKAIQRRIKTYFGRFDMCMFGGKRFKKTGILSNSKHVMSFQMVCNNRHKHLPFKVRGGKFDTSQEAEYPTKFCRILTQAVAEDLSVRFGVKWNFKQLKLSQLAAVASGKQPKSLPNLIPEFAPIVPVHGVPLDATFAVSSKQQLKRCYDLDFISSTDRIRVHRGAKILRRTEKGPNRMRQRYRTMWWEGKLFISMQFLGYVMFSLVRTFRSQRCNTCLVVTAILALHLAGVAKQFNLFRVNLCAMLFLECHGLR